MINRVLLVPVIACSLIAGAAVAAEVPAYVTAALADPGRPEADRTRTFGAVWEAVKAHLEPVDRQWTLAISMDVEEFGERLAYKQNRIHEKLGTRPFAKVVS